MNEVKISTSNNKLGNIPSFSLPSIIACPAHTNLCASICYASKIERIYKNAKLSYEANLKLIEDINFVEVITTKIKKLAQRKKNPITTFRWHVSGDIFSIKYLYHMQKIMLAFPNITFYAYTRNWALKNWMPHLETLRQLANFTLIASLDDEHLNLKILPPNNWRIAYVGNKVLTDISKETNNKFIVCPNQSNKTKTILCDTCKYCFNPLVKNTTHSIYFIKH